MLTAQQIINLVCQNAKAPGFTLQAGQLLNVVLADLCQTYDFDLARKTTLVTLGTLLGSGPYPLPSDYLRARYNEVFYSIDGVPYTLISIDLDEFDRLVNQSGISNFPEFFATDMSTSPPSLYVWPPASGSYPTTIRYQAQLPDISSPESSATIPWFPNQQYLITATTAALMGITDDDRATAWTVRAQGELKQYLTLKDDKEGRAQQVKLDRRQFGPSFSNLKNTKTIGW